MTGRKQRYLLATVLLVAAAATAAGVHFTPHTHWVQTWGPGAAIACIQLAIAVGVVEWVVDRVRAQDEAPGRMLAIAYATTLNREVGTLLQVTAATYRRETNTPAELEPADFLSQNPDILGSMGLNVSAQVVPARPLGEFMVTQVESIRRAHDVGGAFIASFSPPEVANAAYDLMTGSGALFLNACRHFPAIVAYSGNYPDYTAHPEAAGLGDFAQAAKRLTAAINASRQSSKI